MIFNDDPHWHGDPHRHGDIVEIFLPAPDVAGELSYDYKVEGIRVELEESFNLEGVTVWRARFVDRLGYTVVTENQIVAGPFTSGNSLWPLS
jgi:hypothetical protein